MVVYAGVVPVKEMAHPEGLCGLLPSFHVVVGGAQCLVCRKFVLEPVLGRLAEGTRGTGVCLLPEKEPTQMEMIGTQQRLKPKVDCENGGDDTSPGHTERDLARIRGKHRDPGIPFCIQLDGPDHTDHNPEVRGRGRVLQIRAEEAVGQGGCDSCRQAYRQDVCLAAHIPLEQSEHGPHNLV